METTGPNDAELVASALAGDREAFGQLYDRHARPVRAVVAAVSADWSAVDDMTQESFLRAYHNLGRLREPEKFAAWVVGIARQVGRERRRTLRRDRHEFRDLSSDDTAASIDGQAAVDQRDLQVRVVQRMAELPENERLAVHAYFFDQRQAEAAAELVGLSRSGYYALLQRALARLAAFMAKRNPTETENTRR